MLKETPSRAIPQARRSASVPSARCEATPIAMLGSWASSALYCAIKNRSKKNLILLTDGEAEKSNLQVLRSLRMLQAKVSYLPTVDGRQTAKHMAPLMRARSE